MIQQINVRLATVIWISDSLVHFVSSVVQEQSIVVFDIGWIMLEDNSVI